MPFRLSPFEDSAQRVQFVVVGKARSHAPIPLIDRTRCATRHWNVLVRDSSLERSYPTSMSAPSLLRAPRRPLHEVTHAARPFPPGNARWYMLLQLRSSIEQ